MTESGRWSPHWRALNHDPASVRRQRLVRQWSQRRLAEEVGISRSHMCEIENGTRNANPVLLMKIAKALHCSMQSLERKGREHKGRLAA